MSSLNTCLEAFCQPSPPPQSRQSTRLFLQSSESGPPPHPLRRVCPLPLWFRGGGIHSLAGEGQGVPIQTRGQTLWYSRYIYVLCDHHPISQLSHGYKDEITIILLSGVSFRKASSTSGTSHIPYCENFEHGPSLHFLDREQTKTIFLQPFVTGSMYHPSSVTAAVMVTSLPTHSFFSLRGRYRFLLFQSAGSGEQSQL